MVESGGGECTFFFFYKSRSPKLVDSKEKVNKLKNLKFENFDQLVSENFYRNYYVVKEGGKREKYVIEN